MDDLARIPPQDRAAEKGVIGSCLRDPVLIDDATSILTPDDFYFAHHQMIFRAMVDLRGKGNPVDVLILTDALRSRGQLNECGGAPYLVELHDEQTTGWNIEHHCRIVRDKAVKRQVTHLTNELHRDALADNMPADALLEKVERDTLAITGAFAPREEKSLPDELAKFCARIDQRLTNGGICGIATGFAELDKTTAGMQRGEFSIVAARPGIGKTDFAVNVAANVSSAGYSVRFVSLEMSYQELLNRLVCRTARVDSYNLKNGSLSESDFAKLTDALDTVHALDLAIDDNPYQTATRIASAARRHQRKRGLDLLIVDYLQLVEPEEHRIPRYVQLGQISRRLKLLAKELKIYVMALCQVNRDAEGRSDKKPSMGELRESGSFEQDADVVQILWQPAKEENELGDTLGIHTQKNRNGRTGEIALNHTKPFSLLSNYSIVPS